MTLAKAPGSLSRRSRFGTARTSIPPTANGDDRLDGWPDEVFVDRLREIAVELDALRTPTAGLVAGKKLTLDMPVKVVGVRKRGSEPMFELATFAKQ